MEERQARVARRTGGIVLALAHHISQAMAGRAYRPVAAAVTATGNLRRSAIVRYTAKVLVAETALTAAASTAQQQQWQDGQYVGQQVSGERRYIIAAAWP